MTSFLLVVAIGAAAGTPLGADPCTGGKDEVVICGSRRGSDRYRLPPPSARHERGRGLPRAEGELVAGVHTSAHLDRVDLPGGNRTNRMTITFSMPF